MQDIETAGTLGSLESLLREEIAFWRGYIQQRKADGEVAASDSVDETKVISNDWFSKGIMLFTHKDKYCYL